MSSCTNKINNSRSISSVFFDELKCNVVIIQKKNLLSAHVILKFQKEKNQKYK